MKFLQGITETRKAELLGQLRALWTHGSAVIEGITLSLGDTMIVWGYGLTVEGKPLKVQTDAKNQARAVDRRAFSSTRTRIFCAVRGRQRSILSSRPGAEPTWHNSR